MTKYNLILELTGVINNLLEVGVTGDDVHEARKQIDTCFNQFEEHEAAEITELGAILDKVAANMAKIPDELREYFQTIEDFKNINEIVLQALPPRYAHHGIEMVQLMASLFDTVNQLLDNGVTPCMAHDAHNKIDCLFHRFETILGEFAEVEAARFKDSSISHFFPNLADDMAKLTLFPV